MAKKRMWLLFGVFGLCGLLAGVVQAGGWAVLTLERWPEQVIAGEAFTVRYALRQHGERLASGFEGTVTAVHTETGEKLEFAAKDAGEAGRYEATLLLPTAGEWHWHIESFGRFQMPPLLVQSNADTAVTMTTPSPYFLAQSTPIYTGLLVLGGVVTIAVAIFLWMRQRTRFAPVIALLGLTLCLAGFVITPAPGIVASEADSPPTAERGETLFVAKGCISCHQHDAINYPDIQTNMGPNLTNHKVSPEFLRLWLHDPAQVRPATLMPNLELADDEIEALIAFLQPH